MAVDFSKKKVAQFSIRVPSEGFGQVLQELVELVSATVGTRVTQGQAVEIAIREAVERRKSAKPVGDGQ